MEDLLSKIKNHKKLTLFILAIFTLLGAKSSVHGQEAAVNDDEPVEGLVYDEMNQNERTDASSEDILEEVNLESVENDGSHEEAGQFELVDNSSLNDSETVIVNAPESDSWQTDPSNNHVSGSDPPTIPEIITVIDDSVYNVNWDQVHELNATDFVVVESGQSVMWETEPIYTGNNDLTLTALVSNESGEVVKSHSINFKVSTAQTRRTNLNSASTGAEFRNVNDVSRDGIVNLNTISPEPELQVKINGQPPTIGASINTGDKVDVRMLFKLPRHTLSEHNAQQLNYVTDIPLVEAVAAKPLVINDRVVGDYSVATSGEITLTISDEQFDYVNGLHSSGFAEYSGVASYISDSTSDVNLGSSTNVIDLDSKEPPPTDVPKEYGINVSKRSGFYNVATGRTRYTIEVNSIKDGSPDVVNITDTLTYTSQSDPNFIGQYLPETFSVRKIATETGQITSVNSNPVFSASGDSFNLTLDRLGAGENYSIGYSVQTPLDASGHLTNIINVTSGSDSKTAADVKDIVVKDFNPGDYVLPNNPRIAKSMMDITRNGSVTRMTPVQDEDRWEYQDTHVNDNFQYKIVIYTEPEEDLGQAGDIYMVDTLPDGMAYDLNVPLRVSYTSHTPNRTPNRTGGFDSFDNEITRRDMADSVNGQIFKLQIPSSVLARINQENGNQHVGEFKENYITITYDINLVDQDEWSRDSLIEKTYKNVAVVESEVSAPTEATHTLTTYKNQGPAPVMSKAGHVNAENETIDYEIVINPDAVKLTSSPGDNLIKLVDRISPQNTEAGGVQFNVIMDSVELREYSGDADQPVAPGARQFRPVDLKQSANGLEMMVPDQQAMVLTYQVDVARNGYTGPITISNTADLAGYTSTSGQQKLSEVDSNAGMDGSFQAIKIRKIDAENSGKPLSKDMLLTDVKYDIDAYENSSWQNKMKNVSPDSNSKVVDIDFTRFNAKDVYGTDFTKNTLYKITETQAPSGYRLSASPQYFVWTDQNVDPAVVYKNIEKPADVSQSEIKFLQKSGETPFTFENEKISITPYTLPQPEPDPVPGDTTIIKGQKIWQGDENYPGVRPDSVVIQAINFDTKEVVSEKTVTEANSWEYQFELPATDSSGNLIDYQLVEKLDSNSNYQSYEEQQVLDWKIGVWSDKHGKNVNLTPINVVNTYTPTTSVKVTKEWNHGHNPTSNQPNEITVNLLADGVKVDQAVIQADSNGKWEHEFTNLPFEQNGKMINYTVTEEAVSNYRTVVDNSYQNAEITNTYIPETISVSGSKVWDDANNQDGKRPTSVTVKLLKDGVDTETTAVASESNGWTYSFDNLPKYYNGTLVNYSVQEVMDSKNPYTSEVTKTQEGYDITNSYTPETISVSGTKTWDDANNQDGKRPESITVELLADGVKIDEKVVSENTNWEYSFDNLPRYKNGKEIVYTIGEELVLGYTTTVDGYDITNSYTPETITVSGVKTWDDANNQDGKRPESIVVRLMNGNQEVANSIVDETTNWSYSFKDLPKYSAGVEIQYSVTEDSVAGYTTTVDGYDITNSYVPVTPTEDPVEEPTVPEEPETPSEDPVEEPTVPEEPETPTEYPVEEPTVPEEPETPTEDPVEEPIVPEEPETPTEDPAEESIEPVVPAQIIIIPDEAPVSRPHVEPIQIEDAENTSEQTSIEIIQKVDASKKSQKVNPKGEKLPETGEYAWKIIFHAFLFTLLGLHLVFKPKKLKV